MRIYEVELENCGVLFGLNKLLLSNGQSSDIFFVSGEAGSGKTTILRAIKWCLYGESPQLSLSSLPSLKALQETKAGDVVASVVLKVEQADRKLMIQRKICRGSDSGELNQSFDVFSREPDEFWSRLAEPTSFVDSNFPESLTRVFFLEGEMLQDPETFRILIKNLADQNILVGKILEEFRIRFGEAFTNMTWKSLKAAVTTDIALTVRDEQDKEILHNLAASDKHLVALSLLIALRLAMKNEVAMPLIIDHPLARFGDFELDHVADYFLRNAGANQFLIFENERTALRLKDMIHANSRLVLSETTSYSRIASS